ncbi:MAG: protein kinase domain-containing protein, partial [Candidatus Dormibacteraceae bacterium]
MRLGPAPDFVPRQIGRYLTKAELGRGGAGAVYLAVDSVTQREVAIKELIVAPDVDPTALHRFEQEWRVMSRINHPNIV